MAGIKIAQNPPEAIRTFRERVPAACRQVYLETASTGLIPDFVYEGVRRYEEDRYRRGGDSLWRYEDGEVGTLDMLERSRRAMAQLIGADAGELAFGQSSTQMLTMITEGIAYRPGDNVVTVDRGWIGGRYAWQKKEEDGLELRYAVPKGGRVTPEQLIALCDERTRVLSVNWVESQTGYRLDVEHLGRFCREQGIILAVDAMQAVGALDIDVHTAGVDFLVGSDYKWMMNYCGTGYAYIRRELQPLITGWGAGWMSDTDRFDTSKARLSPRPDAGRFELGYPHADGIYGMGLVAANNCRIGRQDIEAYTCGLARYFRERVETLPGLRLRYDFPEENQCQICTLQLEPRISLSNEQLQAAGIVAHALPADAAGEREMRLSFHYYNNTEDIDRLLETLTA